MTRGQKRPIRSNWKSRKQMKSKNEKKKERGRRKEENIRKKWFNTLLVFISCWLRYKWYSFLAEKKCFTEVVYLLIITSRLIWRNDQRKKIESCKWKNENKHGNLCHSVKFSSACLNACRAIFSEIYCYKILNQFYPNLYPSIVTAAHLL